jgi:pyroglutamyl-peptidase
MEKPCILLTGFERFDAERVNPSEEIVRRLDQTLIDGHRVVGAILPVAFAEAPSVLGNLLDQHRPQLVIALGQAGGRPEISIERVAINLIDARIADNAELQPIDVDVIAHGPAAYYSSLPVKAIQAELSSHGIPCALSLSAGSFVCNQVFYWLCHLLTTEYPGVRGGFIHVPWLPEQVVNRPGEKALPLEVMTEGIQRAIECSLRTEHDLHIAGGTTH